MSGSVSCKCETTGAGTSNASTTTTTPCDSAFFWPVTWIVNVWLLLLRPFTEKTRTLISSLLANRSMSDTKAPSTIT